ncbi:exopolysaccharide biosynthesis protein VpsF [Arachidicoccus ginsenosidivorans]
MKNLILLFSFFSLFVFTPLLNKLGYLGGDTGPAYFKILPSTYIIALSFVFVLFAKAGDFWSILYRKKYGFTLLALCLVLWMYVVLENRTNSISFMADTLIASAMLAIILPKYDRKLNIAVQRLILAFFVIDCLFAVVERLLSHNFFPPLYLNVLTIYYEQAFRSTALLGHPLNNALNLIVIMGFIYLSRVKYKNLLLLLGMVGLLCFGSRGAIYGFISLTCLHYIIYRYLYNRNTFNVIGSTNKFYTYLYFIFGGLTLIVLLFYTHFGDRLLSVSVYDEGSAGARVRILAILDYVNAHEILWGLSSHRIDILKTRLDLEIIENFWLQWVLRFGLVFTFLLFISITALLYNRLYYLYINERLYLIALFFLVASTNNSLATSTGAISTFILCTAGFNPFRYLVKISTSDANGNPRAIHSANSYPNPNLELI